jgi:hypothetical protein
MTRTAGLWIMIFPGALTDFEVHIFHDFHYVKLKVASGGEDSEQMNSR